MRDLNKILLTGRLVQDVELRYTGGGTAVTDVRLAVNRSVKKGDKWEEETSYVDVTLWGKRAERIAENCSKGSMLFVEGHLKMDTWEDKKTGGKRSRLKVESETAMAVTPETDSSSQDTGRPAAETSDDAPYDDDIPF